MGRLAVWRDHAGKLSALKLAALAVVLWPGALLLVRLVVGDLGGRPITQMIYGTGDWAVRFLLASLAVSPLRAVFDWPRVVLLRRMLGVAAGSYAVAHLFLYVIDQKFNLAVVVSEIVVRFYLTIGFVALLGLIALLVTSTDGWQKRLGARWKKLHRLVFPIAMLGLFHYFLQSKADVTDAVFAAGVFAWLAFWRLVPRRFQGRLALPVALVLAAPVATALVEGAWYGLATRIQASKVLWANIDIDAGPRPSGQVAILALVVLAVAAGRRLWKRRMKMAVPVRRTA